MTSNLKFIISVFLSAVLGLVWYPLLQLKSMQIESSQLLFFAFLAASLLTVTFMARQVEKWRNNTLELLIFALTGGVSNGLLHYSLLFGNPIVVLSLFCISMVASLFLTRLSKGHNLDTGEFATILCLLLMAFSILMAVDSPLTFHWSQILAMLAGAGFYRLFMLNEQSVCQIPILSKLAAMFIASTWLVGIVLIFSPRSASFSQENASFYSVLYGAMILTPVVASVIYILAKNSLTTLLLWTTALLGVNLIGLLLHQGVGSLSGLLWPCLLLVLACIIQLMRYQTSSST